MIDSRKVRVDIYPADVETKPASEPAVQAELEELEEKPKTISIPVWFAVCTLVFVLGVAIETVPFPWRTTVIDADGTTVKVWNRWPSFMSFAAADSPYWQTRYYERDGSSSEGPIRNHKKDGHWTVKEKGGGVYSSYFKLGAKIGGSDQ